MKTTIIALLAICTLTASGQTSMEHLQNGISKHKQRDFAGAIKDYDLSIQEDGTNKEAYYNRGACELALKDFKSAMNDFSKVIDLDPKYAGAYGNRAAILVGEKRYAEAVSDLDMAITLDPTFPNVLTLRGQIRAQTGNRVGACEDFHRAKQVGDKLADKYISRFCGNEQLLGESLRLDWPDSENWIVGDDQENEQQRVIDLIHSDETIDKWTELGNMTSIKGVTGVPMDKVMNMLFDGARQKSPKCKVTFIEKDESVEHPWAIFTIESPGFINDSTPESQLWYVVQGKQALYYNFRAVKQASIPADLRDKWIKFFKTGTIVYK